MSASFSSGVMPIAVFFGVASLLNAQPAQVAPKKGSEIKTPSQASVEKDVPTESTSTLLQNVKVPYNTSLIRDPFASPTDISQSNRVESIDEIGIKGRVSMRSKSFAIITDSRGKTRMVPVGYRFKDGEIISISETSVTFRQWDPNSVTRSAAKTVVKSFKREEDKR